MDANQVVAALVDPKNGVIVKMIDRLGKLEGERASIADAVGQQARDIDALDDRIIKIEQGTGQHITILGQQVDDFGKEIAALIERVAVLEAKAEAPKRSRKKKAEPEPPAIDPEVPLDEPTTIPQVEPEVVDPEAPAYEPGLVPDEVAGVKITGNVVMSIRNNIKVLTLQLAKTLNTEYPPELYDFVAGLTDDEAAAIAEKFPG